MEKWEIALNKFLEQYINETTFESADVEHAWDITLYVTNKQCEAFSETINRVGRKILFGMLKG